MTDLPIPVVADIGLRPVSLRRFATPYHQSFCRNCSWESYDYPTKDAAEDAGDLHAARCCDRLNMELALQVNVTAVEAKHLREGDVLLLKDLRTLTIHDVSLEPDWGKVIITYTTNLSLEPNLLEIPANRVVKVVA